MTHYITAENRSRYAMVAAVLALVGGGVAVLLTRASEELPTMGERFIDPEQVVTIEQSDPNRPFSVDPPSPRVEANTYPDVSLQPELIHNRGQRQVVTLSGTGFSSFSYVDIEMTAPNGTTVLRDGVPAANNGTFSVAIGWRPYPEFGVEGNNGGWPISVTDRYTGRTTRTQLDVRSDDSTPDPRTWDIPDEPEPPSELFEVLVVTLGHMCDGGPAASEIGVKGATAGGPVVVFVLDPEQRSVAEVHTSADARGEIQRITPLFWDTSNCDSRIDFEYAVVAVDEKTNRQARGTLILPTYDSTQPHS